MADRGENYPEIYGLPEYNEWESGKNYKQYDRVNYKGAVYSARKSNTNVDPFFDDGSTWELIYGYSFDDNDTMEVEKVNGFLISGRKVNTSHGVTHSVDSNGINISGVTASADTYGVVKTKQGIINDDGVIDTNIYFENGILYIE